MKPAIITHKTRGNQIKSPFYKEKKRVEQCDTDTESESVALPSSRPSVSSTGFTMSPQTGFFIYVNVQGKGIIFLASM